MIPGALGSRIGQYGGISELQRWLGHRNPTSNSPCGHDTKDCLDGHLACGIRHIAWDLGRTAEVGGSRAGRVGGSQ